MLLLYIEYIYQVVDKIILNEINMGYSSLCCLYKCVC